MQGKVALVTGATNGIGLAMVQALARAGASVVVVGRDEEKGRQTVRSLRSDHPSQRHRWYAADLSSKHHVTNLAHQVRSDVERLDVLVNNAGAWFTERRVSSDGIEMTWALNHLGYFRLTQSLMGLLQRTALEHGEARIVSQASAAHREGSIQWQDIEYAASWDSAGKGRVGPGWSVYAQSKLANIMFSSALARRLAGTGITANCCHPGVVVTGFTQNNGLKYKAAALLRRIGNRRTPLAGALPTLHLASSADVRGLSGLHYGPPRDPQTSSESSLDVAQQERLWALTEQMA